VNRLHVVVRTRLIAALAETASRPYRAHEELVARLARGEREEPLAALYDAYGGPLTSVRGGEPGVLEIQALLQAPSGPAAASVEVRKTGIGRVIELESDSLPILPKGEYYELWFVGPGDRPGRPNRISAGTFHPDEDGRSLVTFAAAIDPALYPTLSVTAEPGDGDPRPTGPEVLRSER
jgi:anti-sigma-K factor RskA